MRTALILVALISLGGIYSASGGAASAVKTAFGIVGSLTKMYQFANQLLNGDRSQELMIESIQEIGRDIDSIIGLIKDMDLAFERLQWSIDFETLESLLLDMTSSYDEFLYYQRNISAIARDTLLDFATAVVSHEPDSPRSSMYRLRSVVVGSTRLRARREVGVPPETPGTPGRQRRYVFRQGLFRQLESLLKASRLLACKLGRSPKQVAYDLYSTVATVFAKTYSMTQFAYRLQRLFGKDSYEAESELLRQSYANISVAVALEASAVMDNLTPVFWRCDPARHERGTTYEEVTELLQGHLENQKDLSASKSCSDDCEDFRTARVKSCTEARDNFPAACAGQGCSFPFSLSLGTPLCERQRPCNGLLRGCRSTSSEVTVCLANRRQGKHRRYNWLEYRNGQVKGRKDDVSLGSCDKTHKMRGRQDWRDYCEPCFCLCDDDSHSERYFSLRPAVSDVEENKIITGVRFVKMAGVFYIQLQQGEPDRLGYVTSSTTHWKPIGRRVNRSRDREGRDYVRLSYYKRSVLLQDLRGSREQVVTGVSFQFSRGRLSLEIRVTNISDVLAARRPARSVWLKGSVPRDPPRLRLTSGPAPPTQSANRSWPDSHSGQLVKFEASSFHLDAAQTTLPLLDVQPVAPRPAVWLAGVGLYHKKGHNDSGGFIGLRVEMADLTITEEDRKALVNTSRRGEFLAGTPPLD